MNHLVMNTPLGQITLFEADATLVALEWGRAPEPGTSPSALLIEARSQLDAYFDRRRQTFDLPLAPAPTPFQNSVRAAMLSIPFGSVRSYGDLATDIASGARAVGTACGRNPLPLIVPCHRVVAAAGRIGGYTGGMGLDTKRALLRFEGALS